MEFKTLKELFDCSVSTYKNNKFLCSKGGNSYTYKEFADKTLEVSALLLNNNIKFSDKVGILSENMPNWGVAFMSCVAYNRVCVPMLPDFSESEISNIITHSECKGLFVSKKLYSKISQEIREKLSFIVEINEFTVLKGKVIGEDSNVSNKQQYIEKIQNLKMQLSKGHFTPDELDLATIIYTSGTTGNSKGVMLTHKNLSFHLHSARQMRPSFEWDVWLSILPLSHTLECSLCFLLPFSSGSKVYYLSKAPTPTILLNALKEVRPTTMLVVPLIIEKIYKNAILPKINSKPILAKLYKTVLGRKLIHLLIGKQLKKMFGGRMRFFGIGGAKLDMVVERFLLEAKFPYAIGYGLTECSPLVAGAIPSMVKLQTTGPSVPGVEIRIDNPNPLTGEGEIVAKGENIMPGYYKNPEATADAFTKDGWFRTKDLGFIDSKGWLSIRGRLNNMIVGPSGENIYPEDIENVINSHAMVSESIVTSQKGVLIAKVCLNPDKLEALTHIKDEALKAYHNTKLQLIESYQSTKEQWLNKYDITKDSIAKTYGNKKLEWKKEYNQMRRELYKSYAQKRDEAVALYQQKMQEAMGSMEVKIKDLEDDIYKYVNSKVNKFSKISVVQVQTQSFEKTATHKIKRYLYTKN